MRPPKWKQLSECHWLLDMGHVNYRIKMFSSSRFKVYINGDVYSWCRSLAGAKRSVTRFVPGGLTEPTHWPATARRQNTTRTLCKNELYDLIIAEAAGFTLARTDKQTDKQ
jgi:hypothetical protein